MKNSFFFYKNVFTIFILVLVFELSKVFADDCEIWNKVMISINGNVFNDFQNKNFANCCEYDGLNCDSNFITGIKITKDMLGNSSKFNDEVVEHLQGLSHLTSLEITHCLINGNLSEKLGNLKNLEILNLSHNFLGGNIPDSLCNLKKLKKLDLSSNSIEGYIPYGFKNLENLETLNLESNNLKGYVPLIPNLKSCSYRLTNLCYIEGTKCNGFGEYEFISGCTEDAIKETNNNNGNPYSDSNTSNNQKIPIIVISVAVLLGITSVTYKTISRKKEKKMMADQRNLINNNYEENNISPDPNPCQDNDRPYTPYLLTTSSQNPPAYSYTPSTSATPCIPIHYPIGSNIHSEPPSVHLNTATSNSPPPYSPPDSTLPYSNYT